MNRDRSKSHDYAIYDVFTSKPLSGNPLAVVFDADDLDGAVMQRLAREFNLSETVFVLTAEKPAHTARLRIFTPVAELPFAGHPTVGASVALARRQAAASDASQPHSVMMLEEAVGDIRSLVQLSDDVPGGFAEFDLPAGAREAGGAPRRAMVADALGLSEQQVGFENHALSVWNGGLPYVLIPLKDLNAVEQCRLDAMRWKKIAPFDGGLSADVFVYCRGGVDHRAHFHARMFAPRMGIAEDPATGSAVASLSGAIAKFDGLLDGHHAIIVEQGVEMGRPSMIHLRMDIETGTIVRTRIGGDAVCIAEGGLHF